MKKCLFLALLAAGFARAAGPGGVVGSKHDLSVTGPGSHRATSERSPCVFCHGTHMAGPGLGDRPTDVQRSFKPYQSSTMSSPVDDPSGASRVCLSCHDGTIALGKTLTQSIKMAGGDFLAPGQRGYIGTDLRGSHPVSFMPRDAQKTHAPRSGDRVRLDRSGQVQCTSCHDPHSEAGGDPKHRMFLLKPLDNSVLCSTCHPSVGLGAMSSHASSSLPIRARDGSSTSTGVAGCVACHEVHGADVRGRLLKAGPTDDATCLACHDSAAAGGNVARDLEKPYAHLSKDGGGHDAAEAPGGGRSGRSLPESSAGARRHVACVDCHDPHTSARGASVAPIAGGAYGRTWGIGLDGQQVAPARFEYEVCLKCHGDSPNRPNRAQALGIKRARPDSNLRLVFSPSAISSHPVAAPGRNPMVPSLRAPYSVASYVYCTDCHASNDSPTAGGAGARGPHGSIYPFMLEREYRTADYTAESSGAYALCYKCHDRERLLSDGSPFTLRTGPEAALHWRHVVKRSAPCSACHSAHGVSREAGTDEGNLHLISFDLSIVRPTKGDAARYTSAGSGGGSCTLTCHDVPHADATHRYP